LLDDRPSLLLAPPSGARRFFIPMPNTPPQY